MSVISFVIPAGEPQQGEGLLDGILLSTLAADSLWFLGLISSSTKAALKGKRPVLL